MQIPNASEEDEVRFRSVVPEAPGVGVNARFGNLGAFVNGNMFAGLFGPVSGGAQLRGEAAGAGGVSLVGEGAIDGQAWVLDAHG